MNKEKTIDVYTRALMQKEFSSKEEMEKHVRNILCSVYDTATKSMVMDMNERHRNAIIDIRCVIGDKMLAAHQKEVIPSYNKEILDSFMCSFLQNTFECFYKDVEHFLESTK